MISVDVIENVFVTLRVFFVVQASRNASVERIKRERYREIAGLKQRLEQNLRRLDKNDGLLRARVARVGMGSSVKSVEDAAWKVDLELKSEQLLAPVTAERVRRCR